MLKVGLIGCGGMGSKHAKCYAVLPENARIVAVADADFKKAEKVCKLFEDAKIYSDGFEMIEKEELDIVDICLPTYLHTKYAVKAMEKGINVFIEKPVCLSEDEAKLLLETEEKTKVKVGVGHVIRFWDEYMWLKEAKDNKTYGKLLGAQFQRLSENPFWGWENWYNDLEKSGSAALDLHIHDADFVRYLMDGEPDEIISRATRNSEGELQEINVFYTYGDVLISAVGVWDLPKNYPFDMCFRVKFEKATAVYEKGIFTLYLADGTNKIINLQKETSSEEDPEINVSNVGAYEREICEFVNYVNGVEGAATASLTEAVNSARLVWKEIEIAGGKRI